MDTSPPRRLNRLLLFWAAAATLIAAAALACCVFLFTQLQLEEPQTDTNPTSPFVHLQDAAVAGRYRWINGGRDHGIITLLPDHTFVPPEGPKAPYHRWEIGRDALLIVWSSGIDRLTKIESPGVFTGAKPNGRELRLEREP